MAITARASIHGIDQLIEDLDKLRDYFRSEGLMAELGAFVRSQILLRTAAGVDADGVPFKPYSQSYQAYRQAYGRPSARVNLFWYGTMLNAMDYEVGEGFVRLFFQPTEAPPYPRSVSDDTLDKESPSSPLKAFFLETSRTKPREFFAVSEADVEAMARMVLDGIDKVE